MRSGEGRAGDWLPEGGASATLAVAKDAIVGGADVGFDAGVVDFFERVTRGADERDEAELLFRVGDRRKVDFPEIESLIEEGDAVGVEMALSANVTDDADVGFLVFFGPAEDELLLGRELVAGEDAGAVKAEEDGGGALGEHAAIQIGTDEEDGDFFRDAGRAAHGEEGANERPLRTAGRDNLVPREEVTS